MSQYLHGYIKRSRFLHGMGLLVLIVAGFGVWGWLMTIKLERVLVSGTENATRTQIVALAALNPGEILYNIDTALLEERVEQHPWVEEGRVSRYPDGTVRIRIREREPVLLVLDASGRGVFYLDREGIRLPDNVDKGYDVPIFHGYTDGFEVPGKTMNRTVMEFLQAVADDEAGTGDLISEVSLKTGQIGLRLEPAGTHGAIPVKLGESEFVEKLGRLHAFWYQQMLPRQDKKIKWIDLRFNSQIVVREAPAR